MEIRTADWAEVRDCLAVDDSFDTEFVWQMDERTHTGQISVAFRLARLPRPMRVFDVVSEDEVIQNLQSGGMLFVADEGGIRGFLDVTRVETNQAAVIHNLAVSPGYRRRGVGSRLVRAALTWAHQEKLRIALLDTSTKNHPAIAFFQKQGFRFCGFNDQFNPNRDIAMHFSLNLR